MWGLSEKYAEDQLDLFIRNFNSSGEPDNGDFIHEYRIAVKRIQTVFMLIEEIHPGNKFRKHRGYAEIRKAFRLGGELREAAVNIGLLENIEKQLNYRFRSFRKFLSAKMKKAGIKHKKFLAGSPRDSFEGLRNKVNRYFKNITRQEIISVSDQFMVSRIADLRVLINNGALSKRLHQARKVIKNIKYIFELRGLRARNFETNKLTLQKITAIEDHIGLWHDWQVFNENLGAFIRKKKNRSSVQGLKFGELLTLSHKTLLSTQKDVCNLIVLQFGS